MDSDLQQKLTARMAELPQDIRATIISADFGKKVHAIGARHQLHIDQIGVLEDEVLLVLLAFSNPDDFVPILVERLHVTDTVANVLADEVSKELLLPLRDSMREFMELQSAKNIQNVMQESLEVAPPTPTAPTPVFKTADVVLSTPTVTAASPPTPAALSTPPIQTTRLYKTDPYHEPVE